MFLLRRSPFGGNPMREMLEQESKRQAEANLAPESFRGWEVQDNNFVICLGYADKEVGRGEKVYVKPNELATLYKLLKRAVDK